MLCFVPVLHRCVSYVCCYVRKEALSQCLTERRYRGLYEVPLSVSLLGSGIETMLANFHACVRYYVFVKSSFKHIHKECEPKRASVY